MAETPSASSDLIDILAHCELFSSLTHAEREVVAAGSELHTHSAGQLLLGEGDIGSEMYVLIAGTLEAFKQTGGGEVILKRLEDIGAHVGERALLESCDGVRRASIRCLQESQVLAVPKPVLLQAMQHNPAIEEHMNAVHERQLQQLSLVEQSVMYRALVLFDQEHGWSRALHFESSQIIFAQGDTATAVYVIRSGSVKLSRLEEDGRETILSLRHDGQTFGEQAVLEDRPRSATATAASALELVALDREHFLQVSATTPELHEYLGTLKRVYAMGGGVATLFDGEFRGQPAVVTVVRLDDGREVIVNHVVNRAIYSASLEIPVDTVCEDFTFRDDQRGILRTVAIRDGKLMRMHVEGPWSELSQVHALLLEQSPLAPAALQQFADSGHLLEPSPSQLASAPNAILCQCLGLTRLTVESAIAHGAVTLEDLSRKTGATTVCGGCTTAIASMVGSTGQIVRLTAEIDILPGVRAFRFTPCEEAVQEGLSGLEPLRTALPGQHVVISAEIDDIWVHRPYTITSPARCTQWREITVKLEDHGLLSSWLFNQSQLDSRQQARIKLSHPKGDFWIDPELGETVVCLVAGIGMTPALAIARSIDLQESEQTLYIDYSARTRNGFAYRRELEELAAKNHNISVHYRCTGAREHLQQADIDAIAGRLPAARYVVCGPISYQHSAQDMVQAAGIRPERVQVEVFTPVGHAPLEATTPRSQADQLQLLATLTLCGFYLLQSAFDWGLASLQALQQQDGYRMVSGCFVLALIGYQWVLPYFRLSNQRERTPSHYHWHRSLGVLAPILLYLHAVSLGIAYTFVLSFLFVCNTMIGALDKTLIKNLARRHQFGTLWLLVHIPLSCLVSVLALMHVVFALAYK